MKKLLTLLLMPLMFGCTIDDNPGPEESYYTIMEGEVKVENFQIVFSGDLHLRVKTFQSELVVRENSVPYVRRGAEIEQEEVIISDTNSHKMEFEGGFKSLEITTIGGDQDGDFQILLNDEVVVLRYNISGDMDWPVDFFIPYKFEEGYYDFYSGSFENK